MKLDSFDIIIVGGGVLGAFYAYHALNQGFTVAILEKNTQPHSASVRNFGQVVPSGMNLKWQNFGRESLGIYKSIQANFDISIRQNGTVYLASNDEEVQLIEELHTLNRNNDYDSLLLTKKECLDKYPGLRTDYCKAGLFFPQEVTVEPKTLIHKLLEHMIKNLGLTFFSNTTVVNTTELNNKVQISTSISKNFYASKVIICNGSDFKALYPQVFEKSDIIVSKLQMLQTKPQKKYKLKGSVLTGLTIRRYEAFQECPSYKEIKAKESLDSFEKKYGIHILFKQALDGSVIIGDSHEYANAKQSDQLGFELNMDIDTFIVEEAKKIINLPNFTIQNRWAGFYSQCKTTDVFEQSVSNNVHIVTGIGGKGMTASAGYSKYSLTRILNS